MDSHVREEEIEPVPAYNAMKHRTLLRTCICVFAVLLLSALAMGEHQLARTYPAPTCYVKAEKFLELPEYERLAYTTGLLDGFYSVAMFGASDETVDRLNSCTKDMDSKQVSAIVSKYVTDHPETWHLPLSVAAYNALNNACPGGLSVHNKK
jgi:hypothetical protein